MLLGWSPPCGGPHPSRWSSSGRWATHTRCPVRASRESHASLERLEELSNATSDSVVLDNRAGARAGVLALLDAGHSRVAFVGSTESLFTHHERLLGYRDALDARGLAIDPALIRTDCPDISSATAAVSALLDSAHAPSALFAGNNRASIGALQGIRQRGGHAGHVGLLGFDDFELAGFLGVSVVAHHSERMGEVAAEIILRRMMDPMGLTEQVVLPTQVILRGSERAIR
jgi:LacI family transcriptional regulator